MINPLDRIETYLNTKIKCDPDIVKQLPRIYLSAYTDNPINAFLIAPSSEGKTYATVTVSEIFPKEDVIIIGRMSPTALIHQNGFFIDRDGYPIQDSIDLFDIKIVDAKSKEEKTEFERQKDDLLRESRMCVDLKDKILIFIDNPDPKTYDLLKPIMSHDKKEISYKTTKGDGSLGVKETMIRNWPTFIFCSAKNEAKNNVWSEIKNRALILSPNTDVKKYAEANKLTGQRFGFPTWSKSIYENPDEQWSKDQIKILKEKLKKLCDDGTNPIINVFQEKTSKLFPSNTAETMRHYTRFNSLIHLETLINADNNPSLIFEQDAKMIKSVFTTINDIDNACKILGNVSTIPPDKIKFMDKIFKPLMCERLDGEASGLTTTQLAKKYTEVFGKPITPKQILENYTEHLEDAGILSSDQEHRGEHHYKIASVITLDNLDNLKSNLIESSNSNDPGIDSCLEQLQNHSIQLGFIGGFYEYDNRIITVEELKSILLSESNHQK